MKITFLVHLSGPISHDIGETKDIEAKEAKRLIDAGFAVAAEAKAAATPKPKAAAKPKGRETATAKRPAAERRTARK